MMWCHRTPEWLETTANPHNCSVFLIDNTQRSHSKEKGYIFSGYSPAERSSAKQLQKEIPREYWEVKELIRGNSGGASTVNSPAVNTNNNSESDGEKGGKKQKKCE